MRMLDPIVFPPTPPKWWEEAADAASYTVSYWKNLGAERGVDFFRQTADGYVEDMRRENPTSLATEAAATAFEATAALGAGLAKAPMGMVEGMAALGNQAIQTGIQVWENDPLAEEAVGELGKNLILGPVMFIGSTIDEALNALGGAAKTYWLLGRAAVGEGSLKELDAAKSQAKTTLTTAGNALGQVSQLVLGAKLAKPAMPKFKPVTLPAFGFRFAPATAMAMQAIRVPAIGLTAAGKLAGTSLSVMAATGGRRPAKAEPAFDPWEAKTVVDLKVPKAAKPQAGVQIGEVVKAKYLQDASRVQQCKAAAARDLQAGASLAADGVQRKIKTEVVRTRNTIVDFNRPIDPKIANANLTPLVEQWAREKLLADKARFLEGKSILDPGSEAVTQKIPADRRPTVKEPAKPSEKGGKPVLEGRSLLK